MVFIPLIIDSAAEFARQDGGLSVLSLPLGAGSVHDHVLHSLAPWRPRRVLVLPAPGVPGCLEASEGSAASHRVDHDELDRMVEDLDSSDCFLVLDTRSWPRAWPAREEWGDLFAEYRGATHGIAIGSRADRALERIECDDEGQVRRVRRLYANSNWPEVAGRQIAYSLVPARCLQGVRFRSLGSLRQELAIRGVLSRDKPVWGEVTDLARAPGYLALNERLVIQHALEPATVGSSRQPGIVLGPGCSVARTARLIPPIMVHEGAEIADHATVVGPASIGANARVGTGAVVAQAVVLADSVVPDGAVVRHQVCSGARAETASNSRDILEPTGSRAHPDLISVPAMSAAQESCRGRRAAMGIKRLADALLAGTTLVVLSPLLLFISILVRLDSRGPILFGHMREGREGKEFRCLKFRTMVPDADSRQRDLVAANQVDGPQFKLANDPRVTRVGRWLRATNLDELPQFFNVLAGHMSLVGPRPSPFRENQICVAWRRARLSVRPGITGLWQICRAPDRSQGDFHEWIYYDMTYVRHFSLWLDVKILLATALTLGGHRRVPLSWMIRGLDGYGGVRPRAAA